MSYNRKVSGVYLILCRETGRYYIGISDDIHRRWREHYFDFKFRRHEKGIAGKGKALMQEDWNKYSSEGFEFRILIERSNETLRIDLEAYLIRICNPAYNTIHASHDFESLPVEKVKEYRDKFLYLFVPKLLREMQGNEWHNWVEVWQRMVQLRLTGISGRNKEEYELMLAQNYGSYFKIDGKKICRIKKFKKR